jgi:hypothetical protein
VTIIPAAPGWHVSVLFKGTLPCLSDHPVVAWEIERIDSPSPTKGRDRREIARYATPVVPGHWNIETIKNDWVIKDPTGRYHLHYDDLIAFDTADEVIAFFSAQEVG